ncbi:MAG: type II toxin-antitoxin system Phd/YefM family antitoxin [Fimbriimonadaceae bacterium]|nr:type II toxin-antitoxin system Phd/YefM family antitoxin [Fimbriimonadaceae bacterium]
MKQQIYSDSYAPNVSRIIPLTDFNRHSKTYLQKLEGTRVPLVLTVNGVAEVVVQDADTYQEMLDALRAAERFVRDLKKCKNMSKDVKTLLESYQE